jgi:hypothetical protein
MCRAVFEYGDIMLLKIAMNVHNGKQHMESKIKNVFCNTWWHVGEEPVKGMFGRIDSDIKFSYLSNEWGRSMLQWE